MTKPGGFASSACGLVSWSFLRPGAPRFAVFETWDSTTASILGGAFLQRAQVHGGEIILRRKNQKPR